MPEFTVQPHALEPIPLRRLRESVLASPYVGDSPLAGSFDFSRGFAMTFRADGLEALQTRFPFLKPFLDLVLQPAAQAGLQDWPARLWSRRKPPNGFYLNLLLVGPNAGVGLHLDGTLREESGVPDAVPRLVSVLYLQVPEDATGGQLRLVREARAVGEISPKPGTLIHFRGDLKHEVLPFRSDRPDALRASLVCEQYHFPATALARLPSLSVHSKNGFKAYLAERKAASAP